MVKNKSSVSMRNIDVSCIIPTYNDGANLADAIISVSRSNYPISEIIVIDDGSSSDYAEQIVEKLSCEIKCTLVFRKKINGGPSSARNMGLGMALGEWIVFLDADDLMLPDSLTTKLEHLDACGCLQEVAGVYGAFIWSTSGMSQSFIKSCNTISRDNIGVLGKVPGGAPAYLFKKDPLLQIGGFDEALKFNEDFDLLLRLIDHGYYFIGTNAPGFVRNVVDNSLTRGSRLKSLSGSRVFLIKAYRQRLLGYREIIKRFVVSYMLTLKLIFENFFKFTR